MRAIIVGAGGTTRELLRRLGDAWELVLVDPSQVRLAEAATIRPVQPVVGDGSSRVVLERAGLAHADALVAATDDDDVNLEACRLASEAGVNRVVAVAAEPEALARYQEQGLPAISPHNLAARRVELTLESRRVASMAFAGGRAEAIELRVEADSPVSGKRLRDLHARSWIVGAILRGEQLIVPHGDTTIEAGDLVTVVGSGAEFADIVRAFTGGEGRFPLDYGKRVAVLVERTADLERLWDEALYLARNSRASSLLVLYQDPEKVWDPARAGALRETLERLESSAEGVERRRRPLARAPRRAVSRLVAEESIGVVVLTGAGTGIATAWGVRRAAALCRKVGRPVLLSRGSHPYRRIVVPARRSPAGRAALRAAVDLARFTGAEILGITVADPVFLSAEHDPREALRALHWVEEEAAVRGVPAKARLVRGNPVRQLARYGEAADLVVLGTRPAGQGARLGLGWWVARRVPRSVLFVPGRE